MNHKLTYQTAIAEFRGKVRILAGIWTFWLPSCGYSAWGLIHPADPGAERLITRVRVEHKDVIEIPTDPDPFTGERNK